jgi:hypothetical protein
LLICHLILMFDHLRKRSKTFVFIFILVLFIGNFLDLIFIADLLFFG